MLVLGRGIRLYNNAIGRSKNKAFPPVGKLQKVPNGTDTEAEADER
jgi:hypothetical protein